jgi:8-oxo-dGTP pyrophosphatase MutT (NUDIX family)
MPDVYVFPGGRLDREDAFAPPGATLHRRVSRKLIRRCRSAPARALAMTIARETWEETGLLLCGRAIDYGPDELPDAPLWRAYREAGALPGLEGLDYVARAITPAFSPKRFNTRFFMADLECFRGTLIDEAELLHLHWVPLREAARRLKVVDVTRFVLDEVAFHLAATPRARARRPVPLRYYIGRAPRIIDE